MSASPTPYTPAYNFTDFQAADPDIPGSGNPNTPLPADKVDVELAALETTTDGLISRLAEIQNESGTLKNASVGTDQLQSGLVLGLNAATTWLTATGYVVNDAVWNSNKLYKCLVAHTSGTFATDLSAVKWLLILDLSTSLDAAAASATAAAASETAAAVSETAAGVSETNAAASLTAFNAQWQTASSAPATRAGGGTLQDGDLYGNTTDNFIYLYGSSAWNKAVDAVNATATTTYLDGDNSTTSFAVTYEVGKLFAYVAGTFKRINTASQTPGTNYDAGASNGTAINFAVAPATGTRNIQLVALGTFSVASVEAGSIDTAQLAAGAVTPAVSEPGAFWWANSSTGSVAHSVTHSPAVAAYDTGMLLRYNGGTGNIALSLVTPTSITSSSTLATVNYTSHGLAVADLVYVSGANETEYNGLHVVATVPNANSFTYYFIGNGNNPATGTLFYRHSQPGGTTAYTGGMTVNTNALGAKGLRRSRGHKLQAGDIYTNDEIMGSYDGTNFRIFNPPPPQCVTAVQFNDASSTAYDGWTTEIPLTTIVPFLVAFRAEITNTASATLRVIDTLGASVKGTIYKKGGTALAAGDIVGGRWHLLFWTGFGATTGGRFELFSPTADLDDRPKTAVLEDRDTAAVVSPSGAAAVASTTASQTWTTLSLDTKVSDTHGIVSLSPSTGQFTPIAGTYFLRASHPFYTPGDVLLRIRNITTPGTTLEGQNIYGAYDCKPDVEGVFTANGTDAYAVQYIASGGSIKDVRVDYFGTNNVFTRVVLQKIG